jgi:hypothetical protein
MRLIIKDTKNNWNKFISKIDTKILRKMNK